MKNIIFPKDIKRTITKKILKEIFLLLSVSALLCLLLTFLGDYFFKISEWGIANIVIIQTVIILLPFLVRKVPFKYFDRSWTGKIIEIKVDNDRDYMPTRGGSTGHRQFYIKNNKLLIAVIMTDDGKIVEKVLSKGTSMTNLPINKFKNGDRVGHLYGTDYVQIIPLTDSKQVICVVCGSSNHENDNLCHNCNHSLKIFK